MTPFAQGKVTADPLQNFREEASKLEMKFAFEIGLVSEYGDIMCRSRLLPGRGTVNVMQNAVNTGMYLYFMSMRTKISENSMIISLKETNWPLFGCYFWIGLSIFHALPFEKQRYYSIPTINIKLNSSGESNSHDETMLLTKYQRISTPDVPFLNYEPIIVGILVTVACVVLEYLQRRRKRHMPRL